MQTKTINVNGALTWWTPQKVGRQELIEALIPFRCQHLIPPVRTWRACLRSALDDLAKELCPRRDKNGPMEPLVRGLKEPGKHGYEVVFIHRMETSNWHDHQFSVSITPEGQPFCQSGWTDLTEIKRLVDEHRNTLTSEACSSVLVALATKHLHGISMRETGGIYWLPESELDAWVEVSQAVARVSGAAVTTGLLEANEETITCVKERLLKQVTSEVEAIDASLTDGSEHGEEWFEKRLKEAAAMERRIEAIEQALSESLDDSRSKAQYIRDVLAKASMATL